LGVSAYSFIVQNFTKKNIMLNKLFLLTGICLLLASCDPRYDIYYIVDNQSDHSLTIIRPYSDNEYLDTSFIATNTELLFDSDFGYGWTYDEVQTIDSIAPYVILNQDSIKFNKDITDIENWDINCRKRGDCAGSFTLTVTNEDFQ